jgi:glyoxylase-like metal-dependent hydrolase (beta-lactamase superfamily II)
VNIFPDVYFLPVVTPTLPPHHHTNSFIVGTKTLFLIDSGLYDEEGVGEVVRYVEQRAEASLERLLLTHRHPDHRVGVEALRSRLGCTVGIHRLEAERSRDLSVDFVFEHGERLPVDDGYIEVIHTPGHSVGHCCFLFQPRGALFTGDHILGAGTSIVVPPEGDMAAYIDSLGLLLSYPASVICPGHGPVVWAAREKILEYIAHRLERERAILAELEAGVDTIEELVARIYTDTPVDLHGMAWFSVQAHLIKLEREGRVRVKHGREEKYEAVRS